MNETTLLTGPWRDARTPLLTEDEIARVGRLLTEHPCLYGLLDPSAVRFFPRSPMSDLGSTSGHYGTMLLEKTAAHLEVSGHLWPIPAEAPIDLAPWKLRFPDTNEIPPNLPAARRGATLPCLR